MMITNWFGVFTVLLASHSIVYAFAWVVGKESKDKHDSTELGQDAAQCNGDFIKGSTLFSCSNSPGEEATQDSSDDGGFN